MPFRIEPDRDTKNADWSKRTWDFVNDKRTDEERAADMDITVEHLRSLPSYSGRKPGWREMDRNSSE